MFDVETETANRVRAFKDAAGALLNALDDPGRVASDPKGVGNLAGRACDRADELAGWLWDLADEMAGRLWDIAEAARIASKR